MDADWSLGEESVVFICDLLRGTANARIIECGAGTSTLRFSQDLRDVHIDSFESDYFIFKQLKKLLNHRDLQQKVNLCWRPVLPGFFGKGYYYCYSMGGVLSGEYDAMIIDGPRGSILRSREACLYQAYSKIKLNGYVILDDYRRENEKQIVSNWLEVYPESFEFSIVKTGHHLAVLKKVKDVEPKYFSKNKVKDNLRTCMGYHYGPFEIGLKKIFDRILGALCKK